MGWKLTNVTVRIVRMARARRQGAVRSHLPTGNERRAGGSVLCGRDARASADAYLRPGTGDIAGSSGDYAVASASDANSEFE